MREGRDGFDRWLEQQLQSEAQQIQFQPWHSATEPANRRLREVRHWLPALGSAAVAAAMAAVVLLIVHGGTGPNPATTVPGAPAVSASGPAALTPKGASHLSAPLGPAPGAYNGISPAGGQQATGGSLPGPTPLPLMPILQGSGILINSGAGHPMAHNSLPLP